MKLKQWLHMTGMSQTELAELAGCSVSTVNRHIIHGRVLEHELIVRIYFITFGAVRPDDYYDLENVPPEVKALIDPAHPLRKRLCARQPRAPETSDVA